MTQPTRLAHGLLLLVTLAVPRGIPAARAQDDVTNPHTATVSGNNITLTFAPGSSAYATDCTEILHVQVLRMNADDEMILPSRLQSTKKWMDATASDAGWVIDSVNSPDAPYYQGFGSSGAGKTSPARNAELIDAPHVTIPPDFPPYDATEAPNGWKSMFWQFQSFAVCTAGAQCGTWYEGVSWTYSQSAENARAGRTGSVTVLRPYVPPSPTGSAARQAYERYAKAKGFEECK